MKHLIEATTDASFYAIQARNDIDLFRYPLDYEVKKSGNSYSEKDYKGKYQVFWAAVPVGYVFDKTLKVKVLEKLFLPKGNGNVQVVVKKSSIAENLLDALDDKSLAMFDPKYTGGKKNGRAVAAYYPSGTVRVWDDYLNTFIPVENVEIKARANFTTITTTTGGNGYYYINYGFTGLINYDIRWKHTNFCVQESIAFLWGTACTSQNNVTGSWSPSIVGISAQQSSSNFYSTTAWRYANVYRGAHTYYTKNWKWGIKTPLPNGVLNIKVRGEIATQGSHTYFWKDYIGGAAVTMDCNPQTYYGEEYRAINLFSTTIHELAHVSHYDMKFTNSAYLNDTGGTLAESWAMGVEYKLTMDSYIQLASVYVPWLVMSEYDRRGLQTKPRKFYSDVYNLNLLYREPMYTPLFIDLMDNYNQVNSSGVGPFVNDQASGFSLFFLEQKLKLSPTNWETLKTNVTSSNTTSTSNTIVNELFDLYKN